MTLVLILLSNDCKVYQFIKVDYTKGFYQENLYRISISMNLNPKKIPFPKMEFTPNIMY